MKDRRSMKKVLGLMWVIRSRYYFADGDDTPHLSAGQVRSAEMGRRLLDELLST